MPLRPSTQNLSKVISASPSSLFNTVLTVTSARHSRNYLDSSTILFEKKKDVGWVNFWDFQKKGDAIQAGVETALVLGNKQRRSQWTKEVSKKFSWIPPKMLSSCVESLSAAFVAIAPKDLQRALKPGGLEKVRSEIKTSFIRNLEAEPVIRQLPIQKENKIKLVEYLVDVSLDFFLKDLELALVAPSVKLQVLDQERREILQCMTSRQRVWYRLRYQPKSSISLGILSLWTIGITFVFLQQNRNTLMNIQQFKPFFSFFGATVEGISNIQLFKPLFSFLGAFVEGVSNTLKVFAIKAEQIIRKLLKS